MFPLLFENSNFGYQEVSACREVCSTWKGGIDGYFQSTNFDSLTNTNGAKDLGGLVLKLPLSLVDINRISEMGLHAGCASFGKKLTLEMMYDERDIAVFPDHLGEVKALLRNVPRFWEQFENLEVRRGTERIAYGRNIDEGRRTRHNNPDFVAVPFGDIGSDQEVVEWRARQNRNPNPPDFEDFEMYIPFLHLLTHLQKVSLKIDDRCAVTQILLRIPRTENLKQVFITPYLDTHQDPSPCCAALYTKCAKSVCFLACARAGALETCAERIVFENLIELHVTILSLLDELALARISASSIARMFPNVTILKIEMDKSGTDDVWNRFATFVVKFPALKYFALSGDCKQSWCANLKTIYRCKPLEIREDPPQETLDRTRNLKTFRFACPLHVPARVMSLFPALEHVIVDEYEGRCRRRKSKATDRKYLKGFFAMFPKVSSITFVPVTMCEVTRNWQFGPGTVTRYRDDKKRRQTRRRQ